MKTTLHSPRPYTAPKLNPPQFEEKLISMVNKHIAYGQTVVRVK